MAQRASDKITKQASAENSFQFVALLRWDHWHGAKSARHADDVRRRPRGSYRQKQSKWRQRCCSSGTSD